MILMLDNTIQLPSWLLHTLAGVGTATIGYAILQGGLKPLLDYTRPSKLPRYLHASAGSWALVTGASDGIGRAFAEDLLSRGFNVVFHGRNEKKLQGIIEELGHMYQNRKLEILVADATRIDHNFAAIRHQLRSLPGKLTVLVNNVGGIHSGRTYQTLDGYNAKELADCINVNATFTTQITGALLPLLRENGPALILNCGSIAPLICPPFIATYVGTKAYLHGWASSLRLELKAQGFGDLVEVLTVAIGNTTSQGNTYEEPGSTLTAKECARSCLDRVGCGSEIIVPHPKYLLSILPFLLLPASLIKSATIPIIKKRYDAEEKAVRGEKKSG